MSEVRSFDLAPMQVASRIERLRPLLEARGCDVLVVTNLTNVRYLTGFTGSAATLVVGPDEVMFLTDGRYSDQAPRQLAESGVAARIEIASTEQPKVLTAAVHGAARVGLEATSVTWSQLREFEGWFGGATPVPTDGLVEGLRMVKDAGELDRMRAAAGVADAALASVRPMLAEGPTEREFGLALDMAIRHIGASGNSFETIVGSGPNSALPPARPTDRRITEGDLVVLDFGAIVDGYCSDMTRTVCIGAPTVDQQRLLDTVAEAQRIGVAAVRAGVTAAAVDLACREVIDAAGWAECFSHGTGHGVGLDIHEAPRVAKTSDATLAVGHVVTVEPGVYLADLGDGVRIEDTVVVTPDGCEPLTLTTKSTAVV